MEINEYLGLFTWERGVLWAAIILTVIASLPLLWWLYNDRLRASTRLITSLAKEVSALRYELDDLRRRIDLQNSSGDHEIGAEVSVADEGTGIDPTYRNAMSLLRDGLSTGEVAARLGLSLAEVDLIAVLMRQR